MSAIDEVMAKLKEHECKYVDFRFTDPRGKWQHLAHHVNTITPDFLAEGVMFDGSSIAGWKAINESDMLLKPDCSTAVMDPFAAQPSLIIFCDVHGHFDRRALPARPALDRQEGAGLPRLDRGRRHRLFRARGRSSAVFDDVRYESTMNSASYFVDSEEAPWASAKQFPDGNTGHRPPIKGGYFPVPPVDGASDLRAEMLSVMLDMGLEVEKHHHEVAPSQHELGNVFSTLVKAADNMQIYKYVVHNVAHQYGKTATFMPKPIKGDNGSGMHVHQSVWKGERPTFAGNLYADLSETALYYLGGIIKHAKAINAFTNPYTNSYKRLIPGFEAPVLLAARLPARNRSASCRIPIAASPKGKRVEVRFPDPAANPYLGFAAMLMAGIDGIQNKIHPGDAMDKNLYDLPPEGLEGRPPPSAGPCARRSARSKPTTPSSPRATSSPPRPDRELHRTQMGRSLAFEHTPRPIEFLAIYYSV